LREARRATYTSTMLYELGSQAALTKLGIDLRQARRLLRAAKQHTVKSPQPFRGPSLTTLQTPQGFTTGIRAPRRGDYLRHELKEPSSQLRRELSVEEVLSGRMSPEMRRLEQQALKPHERVMAEALSKGHELNELQLLRRLGLRSTPLTARAGHVDPRVLLREHNMLTSLGPRYSRVQQLGIDLRLGTGEAKRLEEAIPGFRFGISPRLSRHAQKRLEKSVQRTFAPPPSPGERLYQPPPKRSRQEIIDAAVERMAQRFGRA
jgi:hypothetical protein